MGSSINSKIQHLKWFHVYTFSFVFTLNMLLYLMDIINLYTAGSSDRMMKDLGVQTEDIVQQGMYILHMCD